MLANQASNMKTLAKFTAKHLYTYCLRLGCDSSGGGSVVCGTIIVAIHVTFHPHNFVVRPLCARLCSLMTFFYAFAVQVLCFAAFRRREALKSLANSKKLWLESNVNYVIRNT